MRQKVILSRHVIQDRLAGHGQRSRLSPEDLVLILSNSRLYVPYWRDGSHGRVFYSPVDKKCLVAWVVLAGSVVVVKTIDDHRYRFSAKVLLQAEQLVFGNRVFINQPFPEDYYQPYYTAYCQIGATIVPLLGYASPGISWWRFTKHVSQVADMIQKCKLAATEDIVIEGAYHDQSRNCHRHWDDRLPSLFPSQLLRTGRAGVLPEIITAANHSPARTVVRRRQLNK